MFDAPVVVRVLNRSAAKELFLSVVFLSRDEGCIDESDAGSFISQMELGFSHAACTGILQKTETMQRAIEE